jgi:hypothetical protein
MPRPPRSMLPIVPERRQCRAGRPPKPAAERRRAGPTRAVAYLTPGERAAVAHAARERGISLSALLRLGLCALGVLGALTSPAPAPPRP